MSSSEPTPAHTSGHDDAPPILVVMGVSGSGKSTLAAHLADALGWDMEEGDDLHPDANILKMALGHALSDEDRAPWLELIADWIDEHQAAGRPGIITCSALKRRYRDTLRRPGVVFIHPYGSQAEIEARLRRRLDHFMPESLLDSQYTDLEQLDSDEAGLIVDLSLSPQEQTGEVVAALGFTPAGHASAGHGPTSHTYRKE